MAEISNAIPSQAQEVNRTNQGIVKPKNLGAEVMRQFAKMRGQRQIAWQNHEEEFGQKYQQKTKTTTLILDELYPAYFAKLDQLEKAFDKKELSPEDTQKALMRLDAEFDAILGNAFSISDEEFKFKTKVFIGTAVTGLALGAGTVFLGSATYTALSPVAQSAVFGAGFSVAGGEAIRAFTTEEQGVVNNISLILHGKGNKESLQNALLGVGIDATVGAVTGGIVAKFFPYINSVLGGWKIAGKPVLTATQVAILSHIISQPSIAGVGTTLHTSLTGLQISVDGSLTAEQKAEKLNKLWDEYPQNLAISMVFSLAMGIVFGSVQAVQIKNDTNTQKQAIEYLLKNQPKTNTPLDTSALDNQAPLKILLDKLDSGQTLNQNEISLLRSEMAKHIKSLLADGAIGDEVAQALRKMQLWKHFSPDQQAEILKIGIHPAKTTAPEALEQFTQTASTQAAPLAKAPTTGLEAVSPSAITTSTAKPVLQQAENPLTLTAPWNAQKPPIGENNIVPLVSKVPVQSKAQMEQITNEAKELETQIQEITNQIKQLKAQIQNNPVLTTQVSQLEAKKSELSKQYFAVMDKIASLQNPDIDYLYPIKAESLKEPVASLGASGSNLNSWEVQNTLSLTGEEVVLGGLIIQKMLSNPNQKNYRVVVNSDANKYTIVQVSPSAEANAQGIPIKLEGKDYEITFTADKITLKELPVTATPQTQAQPATTINPVTTKIDASNVSIRNAGDTVLIGGTQRVITFADLESFGLVPKHEAIIKISGTNHTILFSNPVKLGDTRTGFVIYFQDPLTKQWIPRPSYRSASHGISQIPHGIERLPDGNTNWLGKGIIPNSKSATAVPTEIDEVLAELEKTQQILDKPEIKQVVFGLAKNTIHAPIPVHPNNKPFSQVLNHKAIDLQKQYPTLEINIIAPNFGSMKIPQALKPNFAKAENTYTSSNPVYGELQVETYLSNDGKYLWTMLKQISTNRVWVGGLNSTSSPLETTGLLKEIPDIGLNLSTAPLEYTVMMRKWEGMEQSFIDDFGQEYNQKYMTFEEAENSNSYRDVWSLVKENPVIQDYYKAKGITEKLPEIKPKNHFTVRNATLQKVSNATTEAENLHDLVNIKPNNLASVPINLPVVGGMFTGRILKLFVNGKELILTAYFDSLTSAKASLIGVKNTKTSKEMFVKEYVLINNESLDLTASPPTPQAGTQVFSVENQRQINRIAKIGLGVASVGLAGGLAFAGTLLLLRMIKNNEINPKELNKLSDKQLVNLISALQKGIKVGNTEITYKYKPKTTDGNTFEDFGITNIQIDGKFLEMKDGDLVLPAGVELREEDLQKLIDQLEQGVTVNNVPFAYKLVDPDGNVFEDFGTSLIDVGDGLSIQLGVTDGDILNTKIINNNGGK